MKAFFTVLASVLFISSTAMASSLQDAYKKEYSFLEEQKNFLSKRLKELKLQNKNKISLLKGELTQLQEQLISIKDSNSSEQKKLDSAELGLQNAEETREIVDEILDRYDTVIGENEAFSSKARKDETLDQKIKLLSKYFELAVTKASEHNSVRKEKGSFFLADGSKAEGDLIHLGSIASFGKSEAFTGSLMPAGQGKFKAFSKSEPKTTESLYNSQLPKEISLFLYESLEKEVDEKEEKPLKEFIDAGGIIGWVIVFMGLVAISLVFIRFLILQKTGGSAQQVVDEVLLILAKGNTKKALEYLNSKNNSASRVLSSVITNLGKTREQMEDIVSEAILNETPKVSRFANTIRVLAAIAPLMGLLGTVTGMISTFDLITEFGTGDPKILSGGISEALITTELGLIVAIPTLLLGTLLNSKADTIMGTLEQSALSILNNTSEEKAAA